MVRVYISSVIDAPAAEVWALLRDFNGLPHWHPAFAESLIELGQAADKVGCIRAVTLKEGGTVREQLLALSDFEYVCISSILESPLGVSNHVATLKLTPVTDGDRCFAEWTGEFDAPPEREAGLARMMGQDLFQRGFEALKEVMARQGRPA
jgi:uncharacterized protein YndB with AHSA1/START domain